MRQCSYPYFVLLDGIWCTYRNNITKKDFLYFYVLLLFLFLLRFPCIVFNCIKYYYVLFSFKSIIQLTEKYFLFVPIGFILTNYVSRARLYWWPW